MKSQTQEKPTFQEYIDEKYNIKTLGPYDFIEFYKRIREPKFKEELYNTYMKNNTSTSNTTFIPPANLLPIIIPK